MWLDPQPLEQDIHLAYTTYFTHSAEPAADNSLKRLFRDIRSAYLTSSLGYSTMPRSRASWLGLLGHLYPGGSAALAASAMFLAAPKPGAALLDVGCGRGDLLAQMRKLGWDVRGVETDPQACQIARSRGIEVHQGQLETAGFPAHSLDAVTMAHVIEHIFDAHRLLAECARILKPGGKLVLLTPNTASWGHRHFGRDWTQIDPPRHVRLFNPTNMQLLLESVGLRAVRITTLAINAGAIWPTSAAIRRSRRRQDERGAVRLHATLSGFAVQLTERFRLCFDDRAGEDLLAIATPR